VAGLAGDGLFYAAYNLIPGRHQRCWVHLLRDLHDLNQAQAANPEVVQWVTAVRKLYDAAHTWLAAHPTPTLAERRTEYADLFTQACRVGEQYALTYDHPCCTLAKRVLRHQDELFQFVLLPGLPADNNLAERSIRPLVIMRKISGGSRSAKGTATRLTLASLLHTWAARNLNPFSECLAALQKPTVAASP
jgi:transposase